MRFCMRYPRTRPSGGPLRCWTLNTPSGSSFLRPRRGTFLLLNYRNIEEIPPRCRPQRDPLAGRDTPTEPMNQERPGPPLRVALVQVKPTKADVAANVERVRSILADQSAHADLVVFPEAALSGYFLEGGVADAALSVERLVELLGSPPPDAADLVVGFYERWRRRLFNSAAYLEAAADGWAVRHVHRKLFLPTYGVFDEARFVESGTEVRAFDTRFGRFGLLNCEDAWHSLPGTILALDGAELIMVVSASPARDISPSSGGMPANLQRWDQLAPAMASEHGIVVVVSQ